MISLRALLAPRSVTFLLLTAFLIGLEVAVTKSTIFRQHPVSLSAGVVFDLVFVTSCLFYWLVAQPLRLAFNRILALALIMLRVAFYILPKASLPPNYLWPLLVIFVEGTVLITLGVRLRTIIQTYRQLRPQTDAETALHASLTTVFGKKVAGVVIGEVTTVYYVLLGWRLRPDIPSEATTLTTHRQSGQIALVAGLLMVGVIEGIGIHLLLSRWNPSIAFWVTLLTAYGMLFFVADIIATIKRPSYLTDTHLYLRLGLRWRAVIPRSAITKISPIYEKPIKQSGQLNASFLIAPNVLLTFNEPICVLGPYGLQKHVSQSSFFVDNRDYFVYQLGEH